LADQLKKAVTAFDRWTEGLDGIRVYTVDLEQYEAERMERYEQAMQDARAVQEAQRLAAETQPDESVDPAPGEAQ
jgi:hypothetical protein